MHHVEAATAAKCGCDQQVTVIIEQLECGQVAVQDQLVFQDEVEDFIGSGKGHFLELIVIHEYQGHVRVIRDFSENPYPAVFENDGLLDTVCPGFETDAEVNPAVPALHVFTQRRTQVELCGHEPQNHMGNSVQQDFVSGSICPTALRCEQHDIGQLIK